MIELISVLGVEVRLDLMRQIAEVIRFAHDKKVVHRALSPHSILVTGPHGDRPHIKIFNWQVGYRQGSSTAGVSREVTATSHVDRLVEDTSTAYMAPEALADAENTGEHLDVFSLGAIAYHLFSSEPPAANGLELSNKLRETKGLQISSVTSVLTCLPSVSRKPRHVMVRLPGEFCRRYWDSIPKCMILG
jgi:serine/threonine protein kinase